MESAYLDNLKEQQDPKVLFDELCKIYYERNSLEDELKMMREKDEYKGKRLEEYAAKAMKSLRERDKALSDLEELKKKLGGKSSE